MNLSIKKFRFFLKQKCSIYDKLIVQRNRKLDFKDILYFLIYTITNKFSYTQSIANLQTNKIITVSRQAMSIKRDKINYLIFKSLHADILDYIYKSKKCNQKDQEKIFAVDGSEVSFSKKLAESGFRLTKNKTYCKALFSCLYNVQNKLAVSGCIDQNNDERKSFIENLLPYVPANSTILFDRGYYSNTLVDSLISKQLKFIIRMKTNDLTVKDMLKYNIYDYLKLTESTHLLRIVRYKIDNTDYFLITNIMDKSINYFIEIYHKRWFIEEFFKVIKQSLNGNNFNSTDINKIKQELYVHLILTNITRYMENISALYTERKNTNKNYTFNHKISLGITGNNICYSLFYEKRNTNIVHNLTIINNTLTEIKKGRKYPRISIKHSSSIKWYLMGILYKKNNFIT